MDFLIAMLSKPSFPTFSEFVMEGQTLATHTVEEKVYIEHAQAFFGQRSRGREGPSGRRNQFISRGRRSTPTATIIYKMVVDTTLALGKILNNHLTIKVIYKVRKIMKITFSVQITNLVMLLAIFVVS